jgi:sugar phosphate permease
MGAVFMPLTLVATTGLEDADQGLASGLFNTSQQVGGALGLAVLSTLAADKTTSSLQGGAARANALVDGFHVAFVSAAILVAAGALLLLALLRRRHVAGITPEQEMVPAG